MMNLEACDLYGAVPASDAVISHSRAARQMVLSAFRHLPAPPPPPPIDYVALRQKLLTQSDTYEIVAGPKRRRRRKRRGHPKTKKPRCPSPQVKILSMGETPAEKTARLAREIEELTAKMRAERTRPP